MNAGKCLGFLPPIEWSKLDGIHCKRRLLVVIMTTVGQKQLRVGRAQYRSMPSNIYVLATESKTLKDPRFAIAPCYRQEFILHTYNLSNKWCLLITQSKSWKPILMSKHPFPCVHVKDKDTIILHQKQFSPCSKKSCLAVNIVQRHHPPLIFEWMINFCPHLLKPKL